MTNFTKRPGFPRESKFDFINDITNAEQIVLGAYGDTVSVPDKRKDLNKFGLNLTVGNTFETISLFQGTVANETFVSTNIIDSIVSSNAADTQNIVIEGHTVDLVGNMTFSIQTATLNGQTEVVLSTPVARVSRAYVKASGVFNAPQALPLGDIYVYDNTDGITAGVPNTPAATKLIITIGEPQSQKCQTTISSQDYYFITAFDAGIGDAGGNASRVLVRLESRDIFNGGVWRPVGRDLTLAIDQNGVQQSEQPLIIIPKNHDVRVRARTNSNTASVFAEFRGYLAKIVA